LKHNAPYSAAVNREHAAFAAQNAARCEEPQVDHRLTRTTRRQSGYRLGEDCIEGVDWGSSITNTLSNVPGITVPMLIVAMTAHYWLVSAEMAYDHAGSADKTLAFVEGATHSFTALAPEFGDTFGRTLEFVSAWLADRF
jgi:hypothetical protein